VVCVIIHHRFLKSTPPTKAASLGRRDWVDSTERRAASKLDRLETELNGYKTNLIKESIRMGHNDLGDFYYARGDLQVICPMPYALSACPHRLASVVGIPVAHKSCSTTSAGAPDPTCAADALVSSSR